MEETASPKLTMTAAGQHDAASQHHKKHLWRGRGRTRERFDVDANIVRVVFVVLALV